jgi:energy-coupling factor transporter ATP-binding protein EcfA2
MKLNKVTLENVMELEGSIVFHAGKTVVIYGENKAGKSNIIHALRYAFLSKVIKPRKAAGYDELKLVTTKEMAPAEGTGRVILEFEHDGQQFEICREIDRYRDNNRILRRENGESQELDFNRTLTKDLKAGLLDALFAPDSAMGFNHLNEKNIDAVIRELFKEIGNAKVLAKDFKQRVERLREGALARVTGIESEYYSFAGRLRDELKEVPIDLTSLEKYEPGETSGKITCAAEELRSYIDSIEKGELKEWLTEMRKRAKAAEGVEELLTKGDEIRSNFKKIEEILKDREHLTAFVAESKEVRPGGSVPAEPSKFYDDQLDRRLKDLYRGLKEAQTRYCNAQSLAQAENIDFKNPESVRNEKERVLKLLTKGVVITDVPRVKADLVKIDGSVHGLIPLNLMDEDPAFTRLSPEPIPEAPEEQKRKYAEVLRKKIENLKTICAAKEKAESFFSEEFIRALTDLSEYSTILMQNEKGEREKVSGLARDAHDKLLLFTGEDVEMPGLECEEDLEPFFTTFKQVVSHRRSTYVGEINQRTKSVGIQTTVFSTDEIGKVLGKLAEMERDLPSCKSAWTDLTRQKRSEWEKNDAEYIDLTQVPTVADGIDRILDTILQNAFDEQEVIQGIQDIIVEINGRLTAEGLVNACIDMGEASLQLDRTTYKSREITHPCGAERSFFSLAVLTALAIYFRLPVIIDEAANNLDKKHLRYFISLVREFAASYGLQYILSIKETDDFPLDGWVRQFADDLQIYRVEYDGTKKHIRPVDLYG